MEKTNGEDVGEIGIDILEGIIYALICPYLCWRIWMEEPISVAIIATSCSFPITAFFWFTTMVRSYHEWVQRVPKEMRDDDHVGLENRDGVTIWVMTDPFSRIVYPMTFHFAAFLSVLTMAALSLEDHNFVSEYHCDTFFFATCLPLARLVAWGAVKLALWLTSDSSKVDSDDLLTPLLPLKKRDGLLPQLLLILIVIVLWWGFATFLTWPIYMKDEIVIAYFYPFLALMFLKLWVDSTPSEENLNQADNIV